MSAETMLWLNTRTLIGQTAKRGNAWTYRADLQGEESNHYVGAIPVEDVRRRLFDWEIAEGSVSSSATIINADGVNAFTITASDRKAMLRPPGTFGETDTGAILGLFKSGYQGHSYARWLLDHVATILDDDLSVSSAGLLAGGAQAWVEVSVPDTITTPEGVTFRPNLLATTSFDGSLATTYKKTITDTVCDNTRAMALAEKSETVKVRHSRYSDIKLAATRDALNIVHTMADDFAAEVKVLCETTVTDQQWSTFLDSLVPAVDPKTGDPKTGRAKTLAENKRAQLENLWRNDQRVAPWANTAHGVLQAVNTWAHHVQSVKGGDAARAGRNMSMTVTGAFDRIDTDTLALLGTVMTAA